MGTQSEREYVLSETRRPSENRIIELQVPGPVFEGFVFHAIPGLGLTCPWVNAEKRLHFRGAGRRSGQIALAKEPCWTIRKILFSGRTSKGSMESGGGNQKPPQ